jgi:hypothetical protein
MSAPNNKKTSAQKKKFCIQADCSEQAVSHGYCRLHYIANWKHIKFNNKVKAERRLNAYVDRIAKKYPKDYMEKIKEGLESDEKFKKTWEELDLDSPDESSETEREFLEKFVGKLKIGSE